MKQTLTVPRPYQEDLEFIAAQVGSTAERLLLLFRADGIERYRHRSHTTTHEKYN